MSLNPQYMIAPSLQEFFIDKTNNLPMTGGQVYFYSDVNRSQLKNIYTISGSPPNYMYVPLPNPVTLTGAGTFADANGNDVLPYYYPYDSDGNVELYFIQVYNNLGQFQFDREAYPNFAGSTNPSQSLEIINYIPNGQFLLHNSGIPLNTTALGITNIDYTPIAQGGWFYARTHGSTAVDAITFPVFQQYTGNPAGSPRFAVQLNRTGAHTDGVSDIRIRFYDVNKFASGDPTVIYTFQFTAISNNGALSNVDVNLYKYFGTGTINSPSMPVSIPITTINIPTIETVITIPISFGTNEAYTIGDNNDDFVEICINMNSGFNSTYNVAITDAILSLSSNIVGFPTTTNAEFISGSLTPLQPAENGMNLYLPIQLTPTGFGYDSSVIGTVTASTYSSSYLSGNGFPYLLMDGSQYLASSYSSIDIPYRRLLNQFISDSPLTNVPKFGTGSQYATAYQGISTPSALRITVNANGSVSGAVDGTSGIFTVSNIHTGGLPLNYTSYNFGSNTIICIGNFITAHSAATAGTSGFTVSPLSVTTPPANGYANPNYSFTVQTVAASALANPSGTGKDFLFSNATTDYLVWFQITNETVPVGGRTKIQVNLQGTETAQEVANILREVMNGYQQSLVVCNTGLLAGKYVKFTTNPSSTVSYYWWYTVDGVGSDPLAGGTAIPVAILSGDTATQIAVKTQLAVNSVWLAIPDWRGLFLRGLDPNGTWDADVALRLSTLSAVSGAFVGTIEYEQVLSHAHSYPLVVDGINGGMSDYWINFNSGTAMNTSSYGGTETRPVNAAVNWLIRY